MTIWTFKKKEFFKRFLEKFSTLLKVGKEMFLNKIFYQPTSISHEFIKLITEQSFDICDRVEYFPK